MTAVSAGLIPILFAGVTRAAEPVSFATQDGGIVYALVYGKGQRGVVLAHGARFNKESWQQEAESLANDREGGDTQFDEESGEGDTFNVERERDLLLSATARQIVDEIDRALERMKNKTYGVCVPAGRRISLERLDALPYAETCVECKARAERRR